MALDQDSSHSFWNCVKEDFTFYLFLVSIPIVSLLEIPQGSKTHYLEKF